MSSLNKRKLLQGSASNMLRMLLSMLISLVLPPFLVHRMSAAEYSAWVLILQLSAYVNFLDLGLQTAISKFVAEFESVGDKESSRRMLSTAFTLLTVGASLGAIATCVLAWQVPHLFHQMPPTLVHDVRFGLLAVGLSISISLPFGVFLSTFSGLQEYGFPTLLLSVSRLLSTLALVLLLLEHGTLLELAVLLAAFNLLTALFQYIGWRAYAAERTGFQLFLLDRSASRRLIEYCGILTVWTMGSLLISGLDTTIVGHFDYKNTGFYAIAGSATNFMLLLVGNLLGPLLPAISSLQANRTPRELGNMLLKATRFCTTLVCILGLPLLVGGYPLLSLWVGHTYAQHALLYLEVLVLANMIRQLGYPYALVIVALGKQRYTTVAPVVEAIVNLGSSVWLARRYGAPGVAIGTLIGASVGLATHFLISMPRTTSAIEIPRARLAASSMLRPLLSFLPALVLLPLWHRYAMLPFSFPWLLLWAAATLLILWHIGLDGEGRREIRNTTGRVVSYLKGWYALSGAQP
jgi:O-antigen/teichoic acid export membrane protein